ncbi:MAG TPA: DUF2330 domain-containing protein [Thermoanaerobaculia bacterium]|jgi:hypothetical protein|nr:DUF2330 domain-containing protein [Thermoanaerobaculia bacterium]
MLKRSFILVTTLFIAAQAHAFCGFYVAKGDTKIFNRASQVVIVRDQDRTVMTMANDFQGSARDFAVVIPVPTKIERGQIHVAEKALIDHLDAYSSPRLVEYFDPDPCEPPMPPMAMRNAVSEAITVTASAPARAKSLGVTIEAKYTVGEYDILILSATQSSGLATWLTENGYTLPKGAAPVLGSYIRQNMHFFVAKVNLGEQARLGFNYLRPLQVAYESPKFMLPIRLGTVNANGAQELFVYAITTKGRVETTNYKTVKLPSDVDVPLFVRKDFTPFYKALFTEQVKKEDTSAVFLEYAWNMSWCDPCASEPLSQDELRKLGVFWLDAGSNVFLTRLHVRYDREHFPEDLVFQETGDERQFQARYVLHHPAKSGQCDAAIAYRRELHQRQEREAQNVAELTGWNVDDMRHRMHLDTASAAPAEKKWWEKIW